MPAFSKLPAIFTALLGTTLSGGAGPAISPRALAAEPPLTFWTQDKLTGDWGGWRPTLQAAGVSFEANYKQEYLGVVQGGFQPGGEFNGLLELDLDLDTEKLTSCWPGATIHLSTMEGIGSSLSARHIGDDSTVSNIYIRNSFRIFEAYLEQSLGRFSLRVGQLAADSDFYGSQGGAELVNSDFGALPIISFNVPEAIFPYAAPGARLRWEPTESCYLQAAAYDGNPAPDVVGDPTPGFVPGAKSNDSGTDLNLNDGEGALFLLEAGYSCGKTGPDSPTTTGLPGSYKLGGFYHTDDFTRWRDSARVSGNAGIYGVVDQMVWRKDGPQGLYYFARIGTARRDRSTLDFASDSGLHGLGLIPGRAEDDLGLGFSYKEYSRDLSRSYRATGDPGVDHESILELTYAAKITGWMTLQPDAQYVLHPAGQSETRNAWVIGLRSSIDF